MVLLGVIDDAEHLRHVEQHVVVVVVVVPEGLSRGRVDLPDVHGLVLEQQVLGHRTDAPALAVDAEPRRGGHAATLSP